MCVHEGEADVGRGADLVVLGAPVVGDEPQAARRAVGDRMHRAASHSPRRMRGEHADLDFLGNFPDTIDVARRTDHRHLG
jgi:hypothetical protein